MSDKVYITYENSLFGHVTGVYASEKLAREEQEKRGDLPHIDSFELKGYNGSSFDIPINDSCKYYKSHLETIRELISVLYALEGCCCGGLAHIVTDDNNIQDHHIEFIIEEAKKNPERTEAGLVKLIGEEMLKLSIQERALLMSSYYSYTCDGVCEHCKINMGEVDND